MQLKKILWKGIDLYQDGFNPVITTEDLSTYQAGITRDPLVKKYIDLIKDTNRLILIFPIWWYGTPAGLKGFLDKVLLDGVAFCDDGLGIQPLLNVASTTIFTTSEQTTEALTKRCSNAFQKQLLTTLSDVGFHNITWNNIGAISSISNEKRKRFLKNAYTKISSSNRQ